MIGLYTPARNFDVTILNGAADKTGLVKRDAIVRKIEVSEVVNENANFVYPFIPNQWRDAR